jgi:hypothetical protein
MDLASAENEVARISERAMHNFESLPYSNDFLKQLIIKLINREN